MIAASKLVAARAATKHKMAVGNPFFFSQQRYTGAQGEHLGEREGQKDPATQLA